VVIIIHTKTIFSEMINYFSKVLLDSR